MKYSVVFPGQALPETFRLRGFILAKRGCVGIHESSLGFQFRAMSKNYIVWCFLLNRKISGGRGFETVYENLRVSYQRWETLLKKRINKT